MKDNTIILLAAIITIGVLEICAIVFLHINGALLSSVVAVLAGLGGSNWQKSRSEKMEVMNNGIQTQRSNGDNYR